MSGRMTQQRFEDIRVRWKNSSPGPWRTGRSVHRTIYVNAEVKDGGFLAGLMDYPADATFVAHAHSDVPALLDEVLHLREELERARAAK